MSKMRKSTIITILLLFLCNCSLSKQPETFTMHNGEIKVIVLEETKMQKYKTSIKKANSILRSYLKNDYIEGSITPVSIITSDKLADLEYYGVTFHGKIYINLNCYPNNSRELVRTIVHEQLHYQNTKGLNLKTIEKKDNTRLSEYIVYYLTEKLCKEYDKSEYGDMYYGEAPIIPELDKFRDELSDVYLGKKELSDELERKIVDAFN